MAEHGLFSFLDEPTRPISGTCLDHVFARFENVAANLPAGINLDLNISDHCMTGIYLEKLICRKPYESGQVIFSKINFQKLNNRLRYESWYGVYAELNANKAYEIFLKILKHHISSSSFVVVQKKSENRLKPWITHRLIKKIKLKHKLSKLCWKHPLNNNLRSRFTKLCKKVNKDIQNARDIYFHSKMQAVSGNLKKEWQVVNSIVSRNACTNADPIMLKNGNVNISNPGEVANEFSKYFASIGQSSFPGSLPTSCSCCTKPDIRSNEYRTSFFF